MLSQGEGFRTNLLKNLRSGDSVILGTYLAGVHVDEDGDLHDT